MSKSDSLKEEIGLLKVAFGIAVALDASLVAWLVQYYETAIPVVIVAAVIAAVVISAVIVFVIRRAYRPIEELEDV